MYERRLDAARPSLHTVVLPMPGSPVASASVLTLLRG